MIEVYRVPMSKKQLGALPKDERVLLLLMGQALNQISVFLKLATFSMNNDPENEIEARLSPAQSHILLRVLFGTLFEAWKLICDHKLIVERYLPDVDDEGKQSYNTLVKYFSNSKLLYKLRNNFSYHYPNAKVVERTFKSVPDGEEGWEWYLSHTNTNSFYFPSEHIMTYGVMNEAKNKTSQQAAFREVIKEARDVAETMPYFLMPFMRAMLFKHFGEEILDTLPRIIISDAPSLFEFWIPFFAERPEGQ
jgi:hypothetical protein